MFDISFSTRKEILPVIALLLLPCCSYAAIMLDAQIQLRAEIVSFLNLALFITALISIKQYFWPGDNNTLPFQIFNLVFTVLFYAISLPFLIANRRYYEEYELLTPLSVLGKFFLSINISSFAQWVIVASVFINVLYIRRFRKDYFQAGIATESTTPQEILQESIAEHQAEIEEEMKEPPAGYEDELPYKSSELREDEMEEIEKDAAGNENDITKK